MKSLNWLTVIILGINGCHAAVGPERIIFNCREARSYNQLLSNINKVDSQSFAYFVQCRENYQGGNLADLYRASGKFILTNPDLFLLILEKESVKEKELENFLLMLSLDTVDDIDLKKFEIRKRIESIKTVKSSNLKNVSIEILKRELDFLSSIPSLK